MLESGNQRGYISAAAVGVLAALLLLMAWPRMQAAWLFLPVEAALDKYFAGGGLQAVQYEPLMERARHAYSVHEDYRYLEGLSLLYYLRAIDETTYPWQRGPALYQAAAIGADAVARNPIQPATWLRIAQSRAALGGMENDVITALEMSILTGRVEPGLLLQRLELAYAYLPVLSAETRTLVRDQTELAWRLQPRKLAKAMQEGRLDALRVKSVVGDMSPIFLESGEPRS